MTNFGYIFSDRIRVMEVLGKCENEANEVSFARNLVWIILHKMRFACDETMCTELTCCKRVC